MFSKLINVGLAALVATPASAYIRFGCANHVVEERADPIVMPGEVASHAHKIAGGNGFGFEMTYEQARASKCSSCPIQQDFSNYWTPKLYYHAQNGSFISVPMVGDNAADLNGGMVVYYQQRGPAAAAGTLKAFPEGFRMLAGDSSKRNFSGDFPGEAINFACLGAGQPETNNLPNYNCPQGLRAQVYFPSCWDGVNLDSDDHKSHMSYPASGAHDNGPCPASHPVQLISLFFEVLYDTNSFADEWYGNSQPFVFANGDSTGYGFHGDFVNGWDVPTLQAVVDTCTNDAAFGTLDACPPIANTQFTSDEQNSCKLAPQVDEKVVGLLSALPGCNPVTSGPEPAPKGVCPGQIPAVIGQAETYFTDVTVTKGWGYLGCGTDNTGSRTLNAKSTLYEAVEVSVEFCVDFCSGYTYAGLEYGSQCWCDNTLPPANAPQEGILGNCQMPCNGDANEICGGPSTLSIYQKCVSGSPCVNAGGNSGSHNSTTSTNPSASSAVSLAAVKIVAPSSSSTTVAPVKASPSSSILAGAAKAKTSSFPSVGPYANTTIHASTPAAPVAPEAAAPTTTEGGSYPDSYPTPPAFTEVASAAASPESYPSSAPAAVDVAPAAASLVAPADSALDSYPGSYPSAPPSPILNATPAVAKETVYVTVPSCGK